MKSKLRRKIPKQILIRYGELWLLRESIEEKFALGVATSEDYISYRHLFQESLDLRKKIRS